MSKKIILGLTVIFTLTAVICAEASISKISFVINGKHISIAQSFSHEERVFAPIRFIAEELGAQVVWDDVNHTVIINQDRGDKYLTGQNFSSYSNSDSSYNFIKAEELQKLLDDDNDNDLADYRQRHNGGDLIDNDPLVVDVRKKEDYDLLHIPGAIWIDASENMAKIENIEKLKSLLEKHVADGGKNEVVVYCYSGNRSGLVAGVLGTHELPIRNLMYGFDIAWRGTSTAFNPIYAPAEDSSGEKHLCGG